MGSNYKKKHKVRIASYNLENRIFVGRNEIEVNLPGIEKQMQKEDKLFIHYLNEGKYHLLWVFRRPIMKKKEILQILEEANIKGLLFKENLQALMLYTNLSETDFDLESLETALEKIEKL
ncbi:hypothetical protein [Aureivirga marina]|uniref:hypothetical protein n=1 Tax=Aureivirga marina TaxID=1182451 RepID=UPI0018CB3616|nr:hypothetical protein [Aureivirga marina]